MDRIGFTVAEYFASEIDCDAQNVSLCNHGERVKQVGDIRKLNAKKISKCGTIDLLLGSPPCNDFSLANPKRKNFGELFLSIFGYMSGYISFL